MISRLPKVLLVAVSLLWLFGAIVLTEHLANPSNEVVIGDDEHDFGKVRLTDLKLKLQHTFHYRNDLAEGDEIQEIKTSCGCTTLDPPRRHVEPGETLQLPATLELSRPGSQSSTVWLIMRRAGVREFKLRAFGVSVEAAYLRDSRVFAGENLRVTLKAVVVTASSDRPAEPRIRTTHGRAVFHGWKLVFPPDAMNGVPGRWHASIEVHPAESATDPPIDSTVHVDFGRETAATATVHW